MEELIIPFGIGIVGYVAQTKETINIKNAYEDSRFNPEVNLYSAICLLFITIRRIT